MDPLIKGVKNIILGEVFNKLLDDYHKSKGNESIQDRKSCSGNKS